MKKKNFVKIITKIFPHLNSMIFLVTNINQSQAVSGNTPGITELAIYGALTAKRSNKMASSIENLNSVVVTIGNDILANFVNGDTGQAVKFA